MKNHNTCIRHIVLFKLFQDINQEQERKALQLLKKLGENNEDILSWTVERSLDLRKGIVIIENGLFKNDAALKKFRASEKHITVGDFMRKISTWFVGDYKDSKVSE